MSIFKPKGRKYWRYDFWIQNNRFFGSTGETVKSRAVDIEKAVKEQARKDIKANAAVRTGPLTLDIAIGRYWLEWGSRQVNAKSLKKDLARVMEHFGKDRLLSSITDDDVALFVAWRRGHHRNNDPDAALLLNSTVNHQTVDMLRRIFVRARKKWKILFSTEPDWSEHVLPVRGERVRELHPEENTALAAALDPDYDIVRQFSLASGLRSHETLLHWSQVDLINGRISTTGKGDRAVELPISLAMRRILLSRRGHHPVFVFTFVVKLTRTLYGKQMVKGERAPVTLGGLRTHWHRRRALSGVTNYRWHDNRHDFATKLLRTTKNLKLVQRGLNHADIHSTLRYAHVLDDELRAGMDAMSARFEPEVAAENPQQKSQPNNPKVA